MPRSRWRSKSTVASRATIEVRRMSISADPPRLCAIDADCSDDLRVPLAIHDWRRIFRDPCHGGTVATNNGHVVGFATYQINALDVVLSNFGVDASFRREGVGRALIGSLLTQPPASFDGSHFLHVRPGKLVIYCHEEQLDFQLFLRACGVPATKVYRRYFRADGRDCFLFSKPRG